MFYGLWFPLFPFECSVMILLRLLKRLRILQENQIQIILNFNGFAEFIIWPKVSHPRRRIFSKLFPPKNCFCKLQSSFLNQPSFKISQSVILHKYAHIYQPFISISIIFLYSLFLLSSSVNPLKLFKSLNLCLLSSPTSLLSVYVYFNIIFNDTSIHFQ